MSRFINKLSISLLENAEPDTEWKNPYSPNYSRQYAEDVLYHTIGPLTDNPRYTQEWKSPSSPPPGYSPGGSAPRWTQEEVSIAYAGDPAALHSTKPNPRSPRSGRAGAPLYRIAKNIAHRYGQDIDDIYQNGYTQLATMMQPGYDEARSPFISWVARTIKGAAEHGIGGSLAGIKALGGEASKTVEGTQVATGIKGIQSLQKATKPKQARDIANQVKGKYQTTRSYDKHPDNPFGQFSSKFYEVANGYADALESGDEQAIEAAQSRISQLADEIEQAQTPIRGASTGAGEAVSTTSRKHIEHYKWTNTDDGMQWVKLSYKKGPQGKVKEVLDKSVTNPDLPPGDYEGEVKTVRLSKGITSLDVEDPTTGNKQELEASGVGGKAYEATMGLEPEARLSIKGIEDAERIYHILNIALSTDIGAVVSKSPKLQKVARDYIKSRGVEIFAKQLTDTGEVKDKLDIGGRLAANEYRFVLRHLGPLASNYPGKGVIRKNVGTPRGNPNWWKPGEDPEIEPLSSGETWTSFWIREGYPSMSAEGIQAEMTKEVKEFEKLGVADSRLERLRATGKEDALSKTAISAAKGKAIVKLTLLAKFLSMSESVIGTGTSIIESYDPIDRQLLSETALRIVDSLIRSMLPKDKKNSVLIPESKNRVKAFISLPSSKVLREFKAKFTAGELLEDYGSDLLIDVPVTDIPLLNMAAAIACEDLGFDRNDYHITISDSHLTEGLTDKMVALHNAITISEIASGDMPIPQPKKYAKSKRSSKYDPNKTYFHELPLPVQQAIDKVYGYDQVQAIKKITDGDGLSYFVVFRDYPPESYKPDGSTVTDEDFGYSS